jgi:hypothetical protein
MLRKNSDPSFRPVGGTPWKLRGLVLVGVVAVLVALRNDLWHATSVEPLLWGFLPVGLWWQAMVSILAAGMMWLMVRLAWPRQLEELEQPAAVKASDEHRPFQSEDKA